ncbi:hypothetical protein U1Q18_031219 [Sarracenia purpurea var. burkii]
MNGADNSVSESEPCLECVRVSKRRNVNRDKSRIEGGNRVSLQGFIQSMPRVPVIV